MMDVVEDIYRRNIKREPVKENHRKRPVLSMRNSILKLNSMKMIGLIAEFKRSSPSGFTASPGLSIKKYFSGIHAHNLGGISILAEPDYFLGSYGDIENAQYLNMPILVKDFISTTEMIDSSFNSGGDCILLISDFLSHKLLSELYDHALNIGMEVLVEFHDAGSAEGLDSYEDAIIGYNRRNLRNLKMEPQQEGIEAIMRMDNHMRILESGLNGSNISQGLLRGFNGVLVGSSILSGEDVPQRLENLEIEKFD